MKMLIYIIILFIFNYSLSRKCGIDFLKTPKRTLISQENDSTRNLKEEEWKPLRVHLDYSFIENNLGLFNKTDILDLKDKIMPKTKEILEKLFKVKQMKSKLKLLSYNCDQYSIPEMYLEQGEGVDSDVVIFVRIDETGFFMENKIEAAAIHCLQDTVTRRPIAGYITFKPNLDITNTTALDYMVWLALHEITHILVFNDSLYEDYVDINLQPLGFDKVITRKLLPSGKKMSLIKSPKILEIGKNHFGCKDFEGVPLEYNGGPGTVGAHWSKKYMNTDYMIGDSYGENLISDLSLALFEDSGWYKVNYELSNLFLWGKDKGCSFFDVNVKCITQEKGKIISKFEPEFCTNINMPVCSTSNTFRGNCRVRRYPTALFSNERYFEDSQIGGVDILADKCPIPIENRNNHYYYGGSCRVGTTDNISSLEKVCPECACFMSNLREKKTSSFLRFKSEPLLKNSADSQWWPELTKPDSTKLNENDLKASCYDYKCEDDGIYILINNTKYKCSENGLTNIEGFNGGIICPSKDLICHKKYKCKFGCVEYYDNKEGIKNLN